MLTVKFYTAGGYDCSAKGVSTQKWNQVLLYKERPSEAQIRENIANGTCPLLMDPRGPNPLYGPVARPLAPFGEPIPEDHDHGMFGGNFVWGYGMDHPIAVHDRFERWGRP